MIKGQAKRSGVNIQQKMIGFAKPMLPQRRQKAPAHEAIVIFIYKIRLKHSNKLIQFQPFPYFTYIGVRPTHLTKSHLFGNSQGSGGKI